MIKRSSTAGSEIDPWISTSSRALAQHASPIATGDLYWAISCPSTHCDISLKPDMALPRARVGKDRECRKWVSSEWVKRRRERQVRGQGDKHLWEKWGSEIICPRTEDRQCRRWEKKTNHSKSPLSVTAGWYLYSRVIEWVRARQFIFKAQES